MSQFVMRLDAQGQVVSVAPDQRSENIKNGLVKQ
jgi:hypothetical protein